MGTTRGSSRYGLLMLVLSAGCYTGFSGAGPGASGSAGEDDPTGADADSDGSGGDAGETGEPDDGRDDPELLDQHTAPGLRRLTKFEYGNTVRDLLGVEGAEVPLPNDSKVDFHTNNAHDKRIGFAELAAFSDAAEAASKEAIATLVLPEGCALESVDGPCVASVLETLLPRAFRRPATSAEVDRYRALFEGRVAESDPPDEALRVVLEAVLMSPHFLYRSELSTGDQDVESELDGYAVASRLSYLLWSTMPDAALFEAAEDGSLLDRDGIEAEVQRMLDSPRGHVGTHRFVAEWLAFDEAEVITKDASLLEGLPETLQEDVERETELFVADALLGPEHSLDTLLTASHTFANATVAELYGLEGIEGAEFQRVELDTATRRGILTQPLAIAGNSKEAGFSPVQMGRFVREHLLCQTIPPPPPTASTSVDDSPLGPDATFRERLTALTSDPACAGCHVLLNEPGFSFLPYDPIGRYLTADASGRPFDTAGTLTGVDGDDTAFANAGEMLDAIAASDALHGCFTRHYVEFAFGRTLAPSDFVLYHALVDALEASDGDFVDLVTSLTTSPEFGRTGPRQ